MHWDVLGGTQPLSAGLTAYFLVVAVALGLAMGSFLHCFALRYATGQSVGKGRSQCALCGHCLAARDLVPLFSWLFLNGKCRYCGKPVSPAYPAAEAVSALVYLSVFLRFGLTLQALKFWALFTLLLAASFTDLYARLIPDRLIAMGAVAAFAFALTEPNIPRALHSTLAGGLSVSLPLLVLVLVMDRLLKKESMGGGDIKLVFLIGLYFDWKLNLLMIIAACLAGFVMLAVFRRKLASADGAFAFGPCLCAGAWFAALWGRPLLAWYMSLFF